MAQQEDVAQFLIEFKALVSTGRDFQFFERPERNSTLFNLGMTLTNFKAELLGLSVVDYCSGPEQDRDRPGKIWVFGKEINSREFYIKLKICDLNPGKLAICISFHEAERSIKYPFK